MFPAIDLQVAILKRLRAAARQEAGPIPCGSPRETLPVRVGLSRNLLGPRSMLLLARLQSSLPRDVLKEYFAKMLSLSVEF